MNCRYHRGRPEYDELSAIACYQSRSTNQWNAGGECCYAQSGQLITHGLDAGTDDRYHPTIHPVQWFWRIYVFSNSKSIIDFQFSNSNNTNRFGNGYTRFCC